MTYLLTTETKPRYDKMMIMSRALIRARREYRACKAEGYTKTWGQCLSQFLRDEWSSAIQEMELTTGRNCVAMTDAYYASVATDGFIR